VRRLIAAATSMAALLILLLAPAVLAAEPTSTTGRIVLSVAGEVDVPAGRHVETVIVMVGDAAIGGTVDRLVVAGGRATLDGATVGTIVVIDGTASLGTGTTVRGDVYTLDGVVTTAPGAVVEGSFEPLEADLAALAIVALPFLAVLFLGLGLAVIVGGLLVAAFGARQVRSVEALIEQKPGQALVAGIAGIVLLPALAIVLIVTVIGAPVGIGLLVVGLPALAMLGWLVAAIWVGDWLVGRMRGTREAGRPYLAAVLGIVVLGVAGVLPFVTGIATLFGVGGLLLAGWRTLRPEAPPPAPAWAAQTGPTAA
jgi:hypothetical protein